MAADPWASNWDRSTAPGSLAGPLLPELEASDETRKIDDILANIRGRWSGIIDLWRRNPLQCAVDGHLFYEFDNLGKWECVQHACSLERAGPGRPVEWWPCCGREGVGAEGCVPCDHRVHYAPYGQSSSDLEIPAGVFSQLQKAVGEPRVTRRERNVVLVERFDRQEAFRRVSQSERR